MPRMVNPVRGSGAGVQVTDAAHGFDALDPIDIVAEFLAQTADMNIDAAIEHLQLAAKRFLRQIFPVDDLADPFDQGMKQGKLHRSQRYFGMVAENGPSAQVKEDIVGSELAGGGCPLGVESVLTAPLNGLDPGYQFTRIERFGQIVVGAHFQTDNAVDRIAARGQHQDRNGRGVPELPQQVDSVAAGQHDIKNEKIMIAGEGGGQSLLAIMARRNGETFLFKVFGEQVAQLCVVVNNQDSHGTALVARCGSRSTFHCTIKRRIGFRLGNLQKLTIFFRDLTVKSI